MKAFFDINRGAAIVERLHTLTAEAASWVGTPFIAHSSVKGAGVDCVHLAAAIYVACGLFQKFDPPAYSLDGGMHNHVSQVFTWLDNHPSFLNVFHKHGQASWMATPGDCLCFRFALSEHHVGVMLCGKQFIHAPSGRKVVVSSMEDPLYKRHLHSVFRPIEKGAGV